MAELVSGDVELNSCWQQWYFSS